MASKRVTPGAGGVSDRRCGGRIPVEDVAAAFGIRGHVTWEVLGSGTSGATLRLEAGGKAYFLRSRAREHSDPDNIRYEHELRRRLAERNLPVYAPLTTTTGESVFAAPDAVYELTRWADGSAFRPGDAEQLRSLAGVLAAFHQATRDWDRTKTGQTREDDPVRLLRDLHALLPAGADAGEYARFVSDLRALLERLGKQVRDEVYGKLPQAVIHGDLHPGNVLFSGSDVAGIFDFDWANRQERIRDVGDALLFFVGWGGRSRDTGDIWALTEDVQLDAATAERFLASYAAVSPIAREERAALAPVMAARWLQIRIRGMRKVPESERIRFLDRGNLLPTVDEVRRFGRRLTYF